MNWVSRLRFVDAGACLAVAAALASVASERLVFGAVAVLASLVFLNLRALAIAWRAFGRLRFAWVLLAAVSVISLIQTPFIEVSLPQIARLWCGMLVAVLLTCWFSQQRSQSLAAMLFLMTLTGIGAAFALVTPFLVGSSFALGSVREVVSLPIFRTISDMARTVASDAVNPNVMGGVMAIMLPAPAAALLFRESTPGHKVTPLIFLAGCFAMMLFALWFSNSRGAWLGAGMGLSLVLFARYRRVSVLLFAVAVGVIVYVSVTAGAFSLTSLLPVGPGKEGFEHRQEIWSRALLIIQDFPFTGVGMGGFEPAVQTLYPLMLTGGSVPHAHNLFLQIAVDLGLPGLFAWIMIYAQVVLAAIRVLRHHTPRSGFTIAAPLAVLGATAALSVHGAIDAVAWGVVRTAPLVWILWGSVLGFDVALTKLLTRKTEPQL